VVGFAGLGNKIMRNLWSPVVLIWTAMIVVEKSTDAWRSWRSSTAKPPSPIEFLNIKHLPSPFLAHDAKFPMLADNWLRRPSFCILVYCRRHKRCRKMWRIIRMVASCHQILGLLSRHPLGRSCMTLVQGQCLEEPEQVGVRILKFPT
jgi:hypothetical protein